MEFRLLGPLEVSDGETVLPLAGGRQRALLADLLLHANRTVSVERLIDDLWGAAVPDTAVKAVQIYVSRLRKVLPPERLLTRPPGYVIEVGEGELDLVRFERLLGEGRQALAEGRAGDAAELLRQGLALWRGPALAEFSEPFARPEAARLEELRRSALEERIEADLALGRHADLVGELEALVARDPLRERLRGQQMLALYRSGRQAEALESYRAYRDTLDQDLGIEPSPALRDLERKILQQDASLAPAFRQVESASTEGVRDSVTLRTARSPVRYARSGGVSIAYEVVGEGPLDLVLVHGWVCTFQPAWEYPKMASFYRRLSSIGRLILFDKRGTGLSDRVSPERLPDLETRMDDLRAVMDAAGSDRAVLLGISEGGPMCALFAASYPERTRALVLMGTFARMIWAPDYPMGVMDAEYDKRFLVQERDDWAEATASEWLGRVGPQILRDDEALRWYVSYVQRGASPGASMALRLMNREIDVRQILPSIGVPTLVLHRSGEWFREGSRFMGERIPGARVVELPGNEHLPWEGDQEALGDEIDRFLAEIRGEEAEFDRVLATILFTDIVDSTGKATELGDRAWLELLERYHALVRAQLRRFRGREIDTAGDGVFATFDGPARAIRCACALVRGVRRIGLEIRAGLHTGEVELANGKVRGIAVHVGARVAAQAGPGEVLVSRTVKDLVAGSGLAFEDRGTHSLKGVPEKWSLLAVKLT